MNEIIPDRVLCLNPVGVELAASGARPMLTMLSAMMHEHVLPLLADVLEDQQPQHHFRWRAQLAAATAPGMPLPPRAAMQLPRRRAE